jgi:Tol biopolymer transport system component
MQSGNSDIWVQALTDERPFRVTSSPAQDRRPAWSPDGRHLAFHSERGGGGLFLIDVDGSNERQLTTFGDDPQWSPNGAWLLFAAGGGRGQSTRPYVVSAAGDRIEPVLSRELSACFAA